MIKMGIILDIAKIMAITLNRQEAMGHGVLVFRQMHWSMR